MSPTILIDQGYRFFFFSREEPGMHVHVHSAMGEAKYWLEPELELAKNYQLSRRQLKKIEKIIEEHFDEIRNAWHQHFGNRSD